MGQLGFAGEEQRWILCGERDEFNVVSVGLELLCQPLVERSQPTPEGVGCAYDHYVQTLTHVGIVSPMWLITSSPL